MPYNYCGVMNMRYSSIIDSHGNTAIKLHKYSELFLALVLFCLAGPGLSKELESCSKKQYNSELVPLNMSVAEKKLRFRCLVQPAIESTYLELNRHYREVETLINQNPQNPGLEILKNRYNASTNHELLAAIKPHPKSITMAQAAIETAWGTSRFFREAKNLFGIRPTNNSQQQIKTTQKNNGKPVWLRRYTSIADSVEDYYLVLARGKAFKAFRHLKLVTDDPYQLVLKLTLYSERHNDYAQDLASIIRTNRFYELDQPSLAVSQ
jgi:Bax protein